MDNPLQKDIFRKLNSTRNLFEVKDLLLSTAQLYHDGLIFKGAEQSEKDNFNGFFSILNGYIRDFYNGGLSLSKTKEEISKIKNGILKYSLIKAPKERKLAGKETEIRKFKKNFEESYFDQIISVANGGFEPAALINSMDKEIIPVRYSHVNGHDKEVKLCNFYSQEELKNKIEGKKVILSEDYIHTGKTIDNVLEWTKKFSPNEIYVASVINLFPEKFNKINDNLYKVE
ncbi:phosphoribosyltransferase [archaeon]|nr:phosphoribosyltransferase [archaeon]